MLVCTECGDEVADGDQGQYGYSRGSLCHNYDCYGTYQDPPLG